MPTELVLRPTETQSGGVCVTSPFACTDVIDNSGLEPREPSIIIIKVQERIPAGTATTVAIVGVTNPRNTDVTGVFHIVTFDIDGVSEIDAGFDISTAIKDPAPIGNFDVQPESPINGEENTYTFFLTTRVEIIDGDVLEFTFPDQVSLPDNVDDLIVVPLPRSVDGAEVTDELTIDRSS